MVALHLITKKTNNRNRVFVHEKKYAFKGPQKRELNSNQNWVGFETNKKLYYKLRGFLRLEKSCITSLGELS